MTAPTCRRAQPGRRGVSAVLFMMMLVMILGMVAFAVDIGYLALVRTQLQVAADSAALAAAASMEWAGSDPVAVAQSYASRNRAAGQTIEIAAADVVLGNWNTSSRTFTPSGTPRNSVRVTARRDQTSGGEVPLFFARVLGVESWGLSAEATAIYWSRFDGFRAPQTGGVGVLPMAISKTAADALVAGIGADTWSWDPDTGMLTQASDGQVEATMYPGDKIVPGNFGTITIGPWGSSTEVQDRQIRTGLTAEDLAPYGGKFELGADGTLTMSGNPGMSAMLQDALNSTIGETRILPVYSNVVLQGSTAQYTLTEFIGIRILDVDLTGALRSKHVTIQAGRLICPEAIPTTGDSKTTWIYAPVHLVQ